MGRDKGCMRVSYSPSGVITTDKCEIAFEILFFSLRESAEFGQLRKLTRILVLILEEKEQPFQAWVCFSTSKTVTTSSLVYCFSLSDRRGHAAGTKDTSNAEVLHVYREQLHPYQCFLKNVRVSLIASIGIVFLNSSEKKWPLSLQFWKLCQTMEPWVPKPFHIRISFSQNRERRPELVHSNDLICHIRAQSIYSIKSISMCAIQDVLLASCCNITTNNPAFIWYGLAGSKYINSATHKILRSRSVKPL